MADDGGSVLSVCVGDLIGYRRGVGVLRQRAEKRGSSLLGLGVASLSLSRKLKSEMTTILVLMGAAILIVVFGYLLSTDVVTLILKLGGVTLQ